MPFSHALIGFYQLTLRRILAMARFFVVFAPEIDITRAPCSGIQPPIIADLCLEYICWIFHPAIHSGDRGRPDACAGPAGFYSGYKYPSSRMLFRTSSLSILLPKSIYFGSITLGHGQRNV